MTEKKGTRAKGESKSPSEQDEWEAMFAERPPLAVAPATRTPECTPTQGKPPPATPEALLQQLEHVLGTLAVQAANSLALAPDPRLLPVARVLSATFTAWRQNDHRASRVLDQLGTVAGRYLRTVNRGGAGVGGGSDVVEARTEARNWLFARASWHVERLHFDEQGARREFTAAEQRSGAEAFADEFIDAIACGLGGIRDELPLPVASRRAEIVEALYGVLPADPHDQKSVDAVWRAALRSAGHPKVKSFGDGLRKRGRKA